MPMNFELHDRKNKHFFRVDHLARIDCFAEQQEDQHDRRYTPHDGARVRLDEFSKPGINHVAIGGLFPHGFVFFKKRTEHSNQRGGK